MSHEDKSIKQENIPDGGYGLPPWKIIIIDDDPDVHRVTRLAFHDFIFKDRHIDLIHCYSGDEARVLLVENPDIALAMLDVVLEERDTGFKIVEYIRQDLNNRLMRIILRTGHPGEAPERHTVLSYDINDYKSKTELTSEKMIASVAACLRAYEDMKIIASQREGLERIVIGSDTIFHEKTFGSFLREVLVQYGKITKKEDGHAFKGIASGFREGEMIVVAQVGFGDGSLHKPVQEIVDDDGISLIRMARHDKIDVFQGGRFAAHFSSADGEENTLYIEIDEEIEDWERELIEIFGANVATAYENRCLNIGLERTVVRRTAELVEAKEELEKTLGEMKQINEKLTEVNEALESSRTIAEIDMRMAVNVQQNILPKIAPRSDTWDIALYFKPMAGVSGDFYDFYTDNDGDIAGFSLFDVSGHGIASGLITMLSKTIVFRRFRSMSDVPLGAVFDAINDDLIVELGNLQHFLSGVMLRFSGSRVEYVNAGHPDIILKHANGTVSVEMRQGAEKGFYLGVDLMRRAYDTFMMDMISGDTIIAFSDGLFEAVNERMDYFGFDRLIEVISEIDCDADVDAIIRAIVSNVENYIGTASAKDDITIITARYRKML
jgi:serine phosphatase RsbU (regulator of sigma subunit)/CheY-like chemotaxis protein